MIELAQTHALAGLVLVGKTDRLPFDKSRGGPNMDLAYRRADWFVDWARESLELIQGIEQAIENPIVLTAGPLDLPQEEACQPNGVECDAEERGLNRGVGVLGCWTPKSPKLHAFAWFVS